MKPFRVDEEFKNLIPPLSPDEYKQLEDNILADGIRDPLVVWNLPGSRILVDGHNRFEIAQRHELEYETVDIQFESRDDAEAWIIQNQFGRRNLSNYDRSLLALKLKPMIAKKAKEKQAEYHGNQHDGLHQKSDKEQINTKKELATIAGVSHDTIHKVEKIEAEGSDLLKRQVRSGEISINEAYHRIQPPARSVQQMAIEQAEERHEEFKQNDSQVVSIEDIRQDNKDLQTLGYDLMKDINSALAAITGIQAFRKKEKIIEIAKAMDEQKLMRTINNIQYANRELSQILGIFMEVVD